jgi:hypothetical protein
MRRVHEPHEAVDQIVDIAEGAGLQTVTEYGYVASQQGLHDKVRDHAAVVGVHARSVSVEDPRDLNGQFVLAPIIEEQGLGAALALVVTRARADRIDMAPIILALWMDAGIAVNLGRRGL